eukprot:CAMPEP_0206201758 /NCGR_PEP_ID=MMETSP0166-20121206/11750_1 /ASSEMBLY_ACC=CAM_ASM_000260 /TAXON_ID=95228 /ORGANISM="Vannella robusta, Strain DIVA3 518/3/11/1/6" /LENGTH=190 /DNA_ID=CAMNT_0053620517 /DNA_START=308 /DNA_END=880 /DNA_ORIENTATION=-
MNTQQTADTNIHQLNIGTMQSIRAAKESTIMKNEILGTDTPTLVVVRLSEDRGAPVPDIMKKTTNIAIEGPLLQLRGPAAQGRNTPRDDHDVIMMTITTKGPLIDMMVIMAMITMKSPLIDMMTIMSILVNMNIESTESHEAREDTHHINTNPAALAPHLTLPLVAVHTRDNVNQYALIQQRIFHFFISM